MKRKRLLRERGPTWHDPSQTKVKITMVHKLISENRVEELMKAHNFFL